MIRCNKPKRWGLGATTEKPTNTEAKREMEAKLSDIQAARAKQDADLWGQASGDINKS